jgi:hypothetical protein
LIIQELVDRAFTSPKKKKKWSRSLRFILVAVATYAKTQKAQSKTLNPNSTLI